MMIKFRKVSGFVAWVGWVALGGRLSGRLSNRTPATSLASPYQTIPSVWVGSMLLVAACVVPGWSADPPKALPAAATEPVAATPVAPATPVRLAYRFQPGMFLQFEVNHQARIVAQFQGNESITTNESQTRKQIRVVSVDEQGLATLEPVVMQVKMRAQFGDEDPITYDSTRDPSAPIPFRGVEATLGRPVVRLTVKPSGELVKIVALDESLKADSTGDVAADARLNVLVALPSEPVTVGGTWKDRFQVPVTVGETNLTKNIVIQRQYQLIDITGSIARISLKSAIITPAETPQIEAQLAQRTPQGTIQFDLQQGMIIAQDLRTEQTVVNALGQQTQLTSTSQTTERLLTGTSVADSTVKPAGTP
jgi:hypothetical protein